MFVLGAITLAFCILFSTGKYAYLSDFLSGVYTGVGVGLIAASLGLIVKTKKLLKDEKKMKEKRIKEQDERNQMIGQKAMFSATVILMILAYIGLMVSGIFNLAVFWTLWIVIMIYMVTFMISSVYYSKRL